MDNADSDKWEFNIYFSLCIVHHFQVIWEPGKFGLNELIYDGSRVQVPNSMQCIHLPWCPCVYFLLRRTNSLSLSLSRSKDSHDFGVVWQELHKSSFFFFFSPFTRGSANLTWLVMYKFYRKLCRKLTTRWVSVVLASCCQWGTSTVIRFFYFLLCLKANDVNRFGGILFLS